MRLDTQSRTSSNPILYVVLRKSFDTPVQMSEPLLSHRPIDGALREEMHSHWAYQPFQNPANSSFWAHTEYLITVQRF